MIKSSEVLEALLTKLPSLKEYHSPTSEIYGLLKLVAKKEIATLFADHSSESKPFGVFGSIGLPYYKMGAVDSLDLFGLDELIIFSFYWANRKRYKKTLDIGGNIGLHSVLMHRCGYDVRVYEPDPEHFKVLVSNLNLNRATRVQAINAAVSTKSGTAEFVRVLGNTTSSHLEGSKNPYGKLEKFQVKVEDFKKILPGADLIKMDVEGHEKTILLSTEKEDWEGVDALVEVGSKENAQAIYEHLRTLGVNAFAQKRGWRKVVMPEDMPTGHVEGTLFISTKNEMPWVAP